VAIELQPLHPLVNGHFREPRDIGSGFASKFKRGIMEPDRYQKKAFECILAAGRLTDPAERLKLLGVAQQFIRLAAHVGGRLDPENSPQHAGPQLDGTLQKAS
jgi:hypothetical protein